MKELSGNFTGKNKVQQDSSATYFDGSISTEDKKVQCAAVSKQTGKRCGNKAQVGKAVCRNHGANAGRPKEVGKYGKYGDQNFKEKMEEFYSDSEYRDLRAELALLRTVVAQQIEESKDEYVDKKTGEVKSGKVNVYRLVELNKEIRQTIETIDNMEQKRQYVVSIKSLERLMYAWIGILGRHIKDVSTLIAIQEEIGGTLIDGNVVEEPQRTLGKGRAERGSRQR